MNYKPFFQIFEEGEQIEDVQERIEHFKKYWNMPDMNIFRDYLNVTFNPSFKWIYTEDMGKPQVIENPNPTDHNVMLEFYHQYKNMGYFIHNPENLKKENRLKRETLFRSMLQKVHPNDAEMLWAMIVKKLPYRKLTKKFFLKAFPHFEKDWNK